MADATSTSPEPRRFSIRLPRPLWIGVATVILVVAGVALIFGVPAYRQRVAIREIEAIGGRIETRPRGPDWLRRWLGDERMKPFDEVIVVDLLRKPATDALLSHVGWLTSLQRLSLVETDVSDAGMRHLSGLTNLRHLWLNDTRVTDTGLLQFTRLRDLQWLSLDGTQVTDAGLPHLKGLTRLEWLGLCDTPATDAGIAELQRSLPHLQAYRYWFSHPHAGETYSSTSGIIITGANATPKMSFSVCLFDAGNVIQQSAGGITEVKGQWAIRLTSSERWKSGNYRFELITATGFRTIAPLRIIEDGSSPNAEGKPIFSALSESDVESLQVVALPEAHVVDCDIDNPEADGDKSKSEEEFSRSEVITLGGGQPFTLTGKVRVGNSATAGFAPIVLQVIEVRPADDGTSLDVIVDEDFVHPKPSEGGFEYAKAMNVPGVDGRYVLRALYRRARLCETIVDVKTQLDATR